ncbi:MAG: hypothetical protein LUG27_01040 [Clostridiales bacterium]|nr:hypothetical protein [Clostridiales bacterium]
MSRGVALRRRRRWGYLRGIALAEYYYFSGQSEQAAQEAEPFLDNPNLSIRLSACLIYAFANLATESARR